jgi:hypothetical protein
VRGERVTDTLLNAEIRDRFNEIWKVTAKGDLLVATSGTEIARLAVGTNGYVLTANTSVGAGMSWQNKGVTNGDAHDHSGGDGAQINHTALSSAGTYTHTQIDSHLASDSAHIPIGGIIMWNASAGSIPSGFAVCDGSSGTPDLRDKFIVGAGSTYSLGDTGGTATANLQHSHTMTSSSGGAHTHPLSIAAGSAHTHTSATGNTSTDGDHNHIFSGNTLAGVGTTSVQSGATGVSSSSHTHPFDAISSTDGDHAHAIGTINNESSHTHSGTATSGGAHTHTGTSSNSLSTSQSILPPYYALYFIMRVS